MKRIVLITGFETFNSGLYRQAATLATSGCENLEVIVFSDNSITSERKKVEFALQTADVFFASLIFDYDQVMWLREKISHIPIRLVFESALELMSLTQIGKFAIGDKPKGMPKPIQFILSKFTNSKEEDKLAGYISFLKTGPKLLKYIPVKKVQDLRNWLIIYGYWNAGGVDNVASMCWYLAENYLGLKVSEIPPVMETPNMGLLHPDYEGYFTSPSEYLNWYLRNDPPQPPLIRGELTPVVGILLYRKHVISKLPYIPQLIRYFEEAGLIPLPIFINGVEGHVAVRDWMTTDYEQEKRRQGINETLSLSKDAVKVDAVISTIGFPLVGGPAGSMEAGRQVEVAKRILTAKNIPYIVAAPLLIQDIHSWVRKGIGGLQSVVLYALPELDGAIDTIPLGGLVGEDIYLIPERVKRLTGRVNNWIKLRRKEKGDRKVAIILYGFPPGYGATGTAALLNVPKSLQKLLTALKKEGYNVDNIPEDGEEILKQVKTADDFISYSAPKSPKLGTFSPPELGEGGRIASELGEKGQNHPQNWGKGGKNTVDVKTLDRWLGYILINKIQKQWGNLTQTGIKTIGDKFQIGGIQLGNVWIGVQPPLGIAGDPMRLMFEKDLTPHPQYTAFYKWLQNDFQADAIIHFGMHGTVEWLPGNPLGNTGYSWSDVLLGDLPNLYIYAANNPSESMLAKRRGYGVIISHNVPPYGRAGLYKELMALKELINEYREDTEKNQLLKGDIIQKIVDSGLYKDCKFTEGEKLGIEFTAENAKLFSKQALNEYFVQIYDYLQIVEQRLFSSGLHILGEKPTQEQLQSYLEAYFDDTYSQQNFAQELNNSDLFARVEKKAEKEEELKQRFAQQQLISDLLMQTEGELTNLLRGLNGEYIPPAPGGDLLRDGAGVLPTGRNIHALDPYRMPSQGAYLRGREIGKKIIEQNLAENGSYPETVAVMLWGLDAIKTKGESIGILLELVGAQPVKEGTGRIVRYELMPLEKVGHPRIDILGNLSGIFRDTFTNIIELLDDLFDRASKIEESTENNFIRKHYLELKEKGIDNPSARLFSNPSGDFGSLVNDQVVDGNWESGDELADTWKNRNVFSYGRKDKGNARPEILDKLLQTSTTVVQEIDSVEYGLTDIQEYYANTGGLKRAAEKQSGKKVSASFVESFSKDTTPRKLEQVLRMEYRTKLLNPKWAKAMADEGSGGAYEISQRMTALIGWGGVADFTDNWVYDQAVDTYVLDQDMANKLREANPEAFRNIVGRMLEANGRGFWDADEEKLDKLKGLYEKTEDELEGVTL
ncbi:MAG: magnesium chelatase subunit H [Cyanobacteria bacterium]|nr:magnesium chelatase subunit H [Cyanobacteria bacterium CG_2015-16_32_12]NCO76805.1 magnesium chelatase subunit H [Cyanobacteria bacterium CG_2015-22_32_23]NCQ04009.1 magnesium chelatase subunit H [Cyanobacteria bacterium CG_2015-09_32_10]NCS85442.1 magnesium chelatase subunit H [Cyanobacteria bacterium CG_2015-02_32_10]